MPLSEVTNDEFNEICDAMGKLYRRAYGFEDGDETGGISESGVAWGASGAASELQDVVVGVGDAAIINQLLDPVVRLNSLIGAANYAASLLSPVLLALQSHVTRLQLPNVRSIDEYMTYYNKGAGGSILTLQSAYFRDVYAKWFGGVAPSAHNLYFEALKAGNFLGTDIDLGLGLMSSILPFAAGYTIDHTRYSGGEPYILKEAVTVSSTPTVTVTGTAYLHATGAISNGVTWTASLTAGSGAVALAPGGSDPAPAGSYIVSASDMTVSGGALTGGAIYIEAHRPAGRNQIV